MSMDFFLFIYSLCRSSKALHYSSLHSSSQQGAKQYDPTSKGGLHSWNLPMLHFLLDLCLSNELYSKQVFFADDLKFTVKLADIKSPWDKVAKIGPKYGYFLRATKS